jgi:hypothetical protein
MASNFDNLIEIESLLYEIDDLDDPGIESELHNMFTSVDTLMKHFHKIENKREKEKLGKWIVSTKK